MYGFKVDTTRKRKVYRAKGKSKAELFKVFMTCAAVLIRIASITGAYSFVLEHLQRLWVLIR